MFINFYTALITLLSLILSFLIKCVCVFSSTVTINVKCVHDTLGSAEVFTSWVDY